MGKIPYGFFRKRIKAAKKRTARHIEAIRKRERKRRDLRRRLANGRAKRAGERMSAIRNAMAKAGKKGAVVFKNLLHKFKVLAAKERQNEAKALMSEIMQKKRAKNAKKKERKLGAKRISQLKSEWNRAKAMLNKKQRKAYMVKLHKKERKHKAARRKESKKKLAARIKRHTARRHERFAKWKKVDAARAAYVKAALKKTKKLGGKAAKAFKTMKARLDATKRMRNQVANVVRRLMHENKSAKERRHKKNAKAKKAKKPKFAKWLSKKKGKKCLVGPAPAGPRRRRPACTSVRMRGQRRN